MRFVVETMRPQRVEPLTGAPSFICGLAIIRGSPVPVLDLAALLDGGPPAGGGRFVAINSEGRRYALAVDEVLGPARLPIDAFGDLPSLLASANEIIEKVGVVDAQLCLVLACGRLVPDEIWRLVDRAAWRQTEST
jgi:purine-binding chemotaxis protein CheW